MWSFPGNIPKYYPGLRDILPDMGNILAYYLDKTTFFFILFFFHNIVYSKSPVYNNLNGPGVNIKGPCFA